jgi:uroporphyrinogen III methyltransferase / synthase
LPLSGKRVLVTRAADDAEAFARVLRERGADPIVAPTIEVGEPDDAAPAREAVRDVASYDWIVFTARPGVDAFFANLHRAGERRSLERVKVAAVGPKTAERLAAFGVRADLVSRRFTSDDVAHDLLERTRQGDRVLLYVAQENRDVLRLALQANGRLPTVIAAYKTRVTRDPAFAQKVASADVLTFTSGSTVRGFATLLGGAVAARVAARGKVVACIGPITADAATKLGLSVTVVGETFTSDGLLAALDAYFAAPA